MNNPAAILGPHGFTAPLTPHGIKHYDITGHDIRSVSPITGFPKSGYCVRYVHLFPCAINVSFSERGSRFALSVKMTDIDVCMPVPHVCRPAEFSLDKSSFHHRALSSRIQTVSSAR